MKKLLVSALIFLGLTSSVFAFVPRMSYFVNGEVAIVRVFNFAHQPILCSGTAFGQTYSGFVLNSWFSHVFVRPGMYVDTYVYSNYYDPFRTAWAQVDCQFAW